MLDSGLDVAVGSDSLASTSAIDILGELGIMAERDGSIEPHRLLEMATADGAKALGSSDGAGTLAPGARADLAAFPIPEAGSSADDLLASLFSSAPSAAWVMRDGDWLVEDGDPVTMDATTVRAEASRVTGELRQRAADLR